jgi:dipeptidyl aminopeptidase/acylaminoacyl peptidase
MCILRFGTVVLLSIVLYSNALFAQTDLIQLSDLKKIKQIDSVTYSPDGKQIVFTVGEVVDHDDNQNPYRYRTHLWISPTDGSAPARPLTFGSQSAGQPAWHPDGRRLAFVRSHEDKSQIFILSFDGGEPMPFTNHPNGASSPTWSPDGRKLLFTSTITLDDLLQVEGFEVGPTWSTEKDERTLGDVPDGVKPNPDGNLDEIRAWLDQNEKKRNPRVLSRLNFLAETDLNTVINFSHFYIMSDEAGSDAKALTSGYFSFGGGTWSHDSQYIYFNSALDSTTHPDRVNHSSIFRIRADGTEMIEILTNESTSYFSPIPSPNGKYLAMQSRDLEDLGYSQTQIELLDLSTGEVKDLTSKSLDRSTSGVTWSDDNRYLYFTANSNGGTPLYRINVSDGQLERLTEFEKGIRSFDVSSASVSYVQTEVANPFELYVSNFSTNRRTVGQLSSPRVLTDLNARWLKNKKLSYPVQATLQNEGYEIEYWIMKPTNFEDDKRYPLVLQIHGGPSAMWGPGEASMWHEFQYFAARGYGIVYSNPRGSGGYGRDFQAGNYQDWGHGPASDVLAATDVAMSHDWVDSNKLVTTGGSYAGYLVAWIVAHDHRFKAAFAQRGVYDLKTFLGEGNAWRLVPNHFGGFPWEPGIDSVLTANSPLTFVDQIQTPLLIKHGDVDLRTGVIQSEMLYKSLKILEKPVEYVRYPRASHEMSRSGEVQQRMDRILRIYEYFERHIN